MKATRSVPTADVATWLSLGGVYVMPDFDRADHTIISFSSPTAALNATLEHFRVEHEAHRIAREGGE